MSTFDNPFQLNGKKILVTGASSGIGRGIAIVLSNAGAKLYLNGRNESKLAITKELLNNSHHQILTGDITNNETIASLTNEIESLDGIVHSAGVIELVPFKFTTAENLQNIMNTNFTAPTLLTHALLKQKKIQRNGSIIFISSITGTVGGTTGGSMYGASKGAINGLVKSMALDLAKQGIRVNSISPAMIQTEGIDVLSQTITKEAIEEDMKKYPLRRYGNPNDVAHACQYLLADCSNWITGTNIIIDGGFTLK